MFLLSGTFFPLTILPTAIQATAFTLLPLTHLVGLIRAFALGRIEPLLGLSPEAVASLSIVWMLAAALTLFFVSIFLMRRKLVK
jgi:ABC-type polysaccharide/polyol phosphate export permease